MAMNIKKGDTIVVLSGKDKGKQGKVLGTVPKSTKIVAEGINMKATTAVLIGSVIYKACVAAALKFFEPQDMKLITAVLFLVILVIGGERRKKVKKNARA